MIKEYKDERINELIKKSFEYAINDSEWEYRYLSEWNLLFSAIDKMLDYINNGRVGELRLNTNMWYILSDTLCAILRLYDLELVGEKQVSENELVIDKKKEGKTNMKERLLKEFNFIYNDEKVNKVMFVESKEYIVVECESGYAYRVEYNGGNITTTCLN